MFTNDFARRSKVLLPKSGYDRRVSVVVRLLTFVLAVVATGGALTSASFADSSTTVARIDANTMSYANFAHAFYAPRANGTISGYNMQMNWGGTVSKQVTTTAPARQVTVWAQAQYCNGSPTMVLTLDGKTVTSWTSIATSWKPYAAPASIPAGTHTVAVSYPNDFYLGPSCDRNLDLDVILLQAQTRLSLTLSGHTVGWPAQPAATGYLGAISNGPRSDSARTSSYTDLGSTTSWAPPVQCGETLYYGVAPNGSEWSSNEVSISWPACEKRIGGSPPPPGGSPPPPGGSPPPGGGSPPPSQQFLVGVNTGSWGVAGAQDVHSAVDYGRWDSTFGEPISDYTNQGVKMVVLFAGSYNTGGLGTIDPPSFAASEVSWYASQCEGSAAKCPYMEVINEPSGRWYWGGDANGAANARAYADIVKATYTAFRTRYGAAMPKILASTFDSSDGTTSNGGGYTSTFWQNVHAAMPDIGTYYDGVVVHPYGGGCGYSADMSARGNRGDVTAAHNATGKAVYVTELGWPTATGHPCTGDSLQWTQQQQADNIYNFVNWARSTGYVNMVLIHNYRDYGTDAWYGLECTSASGSASCGGAADGTKKPAWNALLCASIAAAESCPVTNRPR
jgi:hypothetical protein